MAVEQTKNASRRLIAHLHRQELCRLTAYLIGGIWHIGWGRSNTSGKEPHITKGLTISQAKADAMFLDDLADVEKAIKRYVTVPLTQGQFDGLVSLVFNKGPTWFRGSHILKSVNERLWANVARLMLKEVPPVGHKFHRGLLRRRQAEVELLKSR